MSDNATLPGSLKVATDKVTYSGDADADVQLVRMVGVTGSEGSKTVIDDPLQGAVNESAPGTDTASSGHNGRLQRIAQRLTSLIALFPTSLVSGRFDVNIGAAPAAEIGAVNETAPGTDTASSGLNGRLQRVAQRLSSLITSGLPLTTITASGDTTLQNAVSATGNGTSLTVTGYNSALLKISGTFVATVDFEASMDAGTTWHSINAHASGGSDLITQASATGAYRINCAGFDLIRARVTWTSGTSITVIGRATNTQTPIGIVRLAPGTNTNEVVGDGAHDAAVAGNPVFTGGYASAAAPTDVGADGRLVREWCLRNGARAVVITAGGALVGGDATNGADVDVTRVKPDGTNTMPSMDTAGRAAFHKVTDGSLTVGAVDETGASAVDALAVGGGTPHDAVNSGSPLYLGGEAIAHGTNPTAVAAADRTKWYFNRAGVPFVIGGHPNVQTVRLQFTAAQTNVAIITVSTGSKIVVTAIQVTLDNASTVFPTILIGFATATTPTTSQVIAAHGGVPAGGGLSRGDGSGMIGVGADNEDLRITTTGTATGNGVEVVVTYYTIES